MNNKTPTDDTTPDWVIEEIKRHNFTHVNFSDYDYAFNMLNVLIKHIEKLENHNRKSIQCISEALQEFKSRDMWDSLTDGMGEEACFMS